jgi:signal transduction histidine kinase
MDDVIFVGIPPKIMPSTVLGETGYGYLLTMVTNLIDVSTVQTILVQQIEQNRAELVRLYINALRETLFTNRSKIRPAALGQIASDEVDYLLRHLRQTELSGREHGAVLCQMGMSDQSLLYLGMATRHFLVISLDKEWIAPAWEIIDHYLNAIIHGFVQNREEIILLEQEQIRSALEKTLSRYMIEIKEVQGLAQRATDANTFKSRLIAQMSHELRTPVGAMMGMAEILQENIYGPLTPAQQNIVKRIIDNSQNLNQIFSQLLDQAHIESGQLRLKEEEFSPQAMVQMVYSSHLPAALRKGLALLVELDPSLPNKIIGDKTRTTQILSNLVVNAIKYTEKGNVVITARLDNQDHWVIEVRDTGIGISPEAQTYIYDPFRQAEETVNRKHDGVGLGLSIVKQLVVAMNGTIHLQSVLEQGSTFAVVLPLHKV